jgi:hypothetical protein
MGVIRSLLSGFDLVTRHPELMALPVLLDLFLWLGPRLSAYPLFQALINLMRLSATPDALGTWSQQMEAFQKLLDQASQASNLFWWLSPALLGVPGLMVGTPALKVPVGPLAVWSVSSVLVYMGLFLLLSIIGLGLAASYWGLVSSRVRQQPLSLGRIAVLWWGLIKVALLLVLLALLIGLPTLFVGLLVGQFSSLVGGFITMVGVLMLLWILLYLAFTIHGVALRGARVFQSVWASIMLMRTQSLPTMGLIMIALLIYIGMGFVWSIPPTDSWLEAAGILGHAFTATGLITATALYYVDRTQEWAGIGLAG